MNTITGISCGKVWIMFLSFVLSHGRISNDENIQIFETDSICLEFNSFNKPDPIIEKFADLTLLEIYRNKLFLTEIIPQFKYSYGQRLFDNKNTNQIDWVINLLRNKPESKSAAIGLLYPNEKPTAVPCLINLIFKIRDESLTLTSIFRSQNALKSYANYLALRDLQEMIANQLDVKPGKIISFVNSPHIYKCDFDAVIDLIKDYENEKSI
jgi:thymidylate synthase